MKKRLLVILLSLLMVFSLFACSSKKDDDSKDAKSSSEDSDKDDADEEDEDKKDKDKEDEDKKDEDKKDDEKKDDNKDTSSGEVKIEEQVLLDQDGIKITAVGLAPDEIFDAQSIELDLENNSDQNVTVQLSNVSVNGYMIMPLFSADVAAGKKTKETIEFYNYELADCGIEKIAQVELQFNILNSESYETIFDSEMISIATSAKDYEQSYDASGEVLYDDKDIKVVAKTLDTSDDIFGPELLLYVENNSDVIISVSTDNVSVNGYMNDALYYATVLPGKKSVDGMTFYDLESNGIEEITDVEFNISIMDADTYDTIAESDVIALTFE